LGAGIDKLLIIDADVLIDYVKSDFSILGLTASYVGEVHVISTVLAEVDGLDEDRCTQLGLHVLEPNLEQYVAATQKRGALSTGDHLCLLFAREKGWTCVSNDGALRRACTEDGVAVLWGLELMIDLVRIGQLGEEEALTVAWTIHSANPFHITQEIVERFTTRLRSLR